MNNEIKVSLIITLQGRVMFSKEECLKTIQKTLTKKNPKTGKSYEKTIQFLAEDWNKLDSNTLKVTDDKGKNPEIITYYTRKTIPAKQSININKEAYNYMTSRECPSWSKTKVWSQMGAKQRLEMHLQRLAESLGGKVLSYEVFND